MKGCAKAGVVIAAPAKAEERLLKFSASVTDKNNCASLSILSYSASDRAIDLKSSHKQTFVALYVAVGGRTFLSAITFILVPCAISTNNN